MNNTLDVNLFINKRQSQASLRDKRDSYSFSAVRFPCKIALYHQKCFSQPLVKNYLGSVKQLPLQWSLLKHLRFMYTIHLSIYLSIVYKT